MSLKRKAENMDREGTKLLRVEARLLELQAYAYDVIVSTRVGKDGATKSTRAFADPLLNLEVEMLRAKEAALTARVNALESTGGKSIAAGAGDDSMEALRRENEELRQHLGEVGQQMQLVRADIQDAKITELSRCLQESNKTIEMLRLEKEAQAGEIFNLKARVKDALASASGGKSAALAIGSDSDSDGEQDFSSFFAAAKKQGGGDAASDSD